MRARALYACTAPPPSFACMQVSELRSQLQKNQGELWMAKTEQHTAAAREVSSAKSFAQPMVVRETGTKAGGSQVQGLGRKSDRALPAWALMYGASTLTAGPVWT